MLTVIKFIKFLTVGLSGMIIDFGITYICKEKLAVNKYISNSLGFSIAAISNFFLNKYFTYQSNSSEIATEFYWFMGIAIISLFFLQWHFVVWNQ